MSDNSSPVGKVSVVIMIFLFVALAATVAYSVIAQGKIQELTTQVTQTKEQIAAAELLVAKTKAEQEQKAQEMNLAQQFAELDSPAARWAMVKRYYAKIAAALKPETKSDLDTVIVYVEKNPVVLVDPTQLPANYAALLDKARAELTAAKAATASKQEEVKSEDAAASPSASIVGKTFDLTGTLNFAKDDPTLGGSYFKLADTNYGDPFYLYLSPANAAAAKADLEGKIVTAQVKVTSQKDGYVTYDVLSGPTLAAN